MFVNVCEEAVDLAAGSMIAVTSVPITPAATTKDKMLFFIKGNLKMNNTVVKPDKRLQMTSDDTSFFMVKKMGTINAVHCY